MTLCTRRWLTTAALATGLFTSTLRADDDPVAAPPLSGLVAEDAPKADPQAGKEAVASPPPATVVVGDDGRLEVQFFDLDLDGTGGPRVVVEQLDGKAGEKPDFVVRDFVVADQPRTKYWIGARCEATSATLRSQLQLKPESGVVVLEVMDNSPAKAAGLEPHDVIVGLSGQEGAAGTPIGSPEQVVKAVEETGTAGKALVIDVIRKGSARSITVKPAERPGDQPADQVPVPANGLVTLYQVQKGPGTKVTTHPPTKYSKSPVTVVAPKAVVSSRHGWAYKLNLENDVEITIRKEGDQPSKVSVKRGKESWEIGENEIEKLPEDLRPQIKSILALPTPVRHGTVRLWGPSGASGVVREVPARVATENSDDVDVALRLRARSLESDELERKKAEIAKHTEAVARELLAKARAEEQGAQARLKEYRASAAVGDGVRVTVPASKSNSDVRLDRIEKSLAELVELQKSLILQLKEQNESNRK